MSKENRHPERPEEMNEHGKKHKRKRHHPFRNLLVLLLLGGIIALLLWRFGGFGWGYHEGQAEESGTASTAASQEAAPTTEAVTTEVAETPGETAGKSITILVGDDITIDGKTYADETALKDYLMSVHDDDTTIELVDDQARKAAYDLAQGVLEALNYKYSEKTK